MARPDLPDLPPDTDFVAYLLSLPLEQRTRALELLGAEERDSLDLDWRSWAHRGQFPPEGDWRTWVLMAGRGFGKTLAGAKWITAQIAREEPLRIALVGATLEDTRRVMVEGASGLLAVAGAWVTEWAPSLHRLKFRSGAEATPFSGASPDMLRGPEHHFA
ncbi:MAG: terminase large subunit domain-containing protein, partial [Allosphingosinicella sp.]